MEHEEKYYLMMMDALDGELAAADHGDLEAHLRACPDCSREWQALLAIDMLFRQAPLLTPAVDFAERTLARLPNRRVRLWALSAVYGVLLLSGLIPLLLGAFLASRYIPVLSDPGLLSRAASSAGQAALVIVTIVDALLSGAGRFVLEQPTLIGWMVILAGLVFLWGGVFQRLTVQPNEQRSRN